MTANDEVVKIKTKRKKWPFILASVIAVLAGLICFVMFAGTSLGKIKYSPEDLTSFSKRQKINLYDTTNITYDDFDSGRAQHAELSSDELIISPEEATALFNERVSLRSMFQLKQIKFSCKEDILTVRLKTHVFDKATRTPLDRWLANGVISAELKVKDVTAGRVELEMLSFKYRGLSANAIPKGLLGLWFELKEGQTALEAAEIALNDYINDTFLPYLGISDIEKFYFKDEKLHIKGNITHTFTYELK